MFQQSHQAIQSLSKHKSSAKFKQSGIGASAEKNLSVSKAAQRIQANHQRRSSERFVTNEGPRKSIRDFNVFEMQGRKGTTMPSKTPKYSAQTKRIEFKQTASAKACTQSKATKKIAPKQFKKQSMLSQANNHLVDNCLPKTEEVDEIKPYLQQRDQNLSSSLLQGLHNNPNPSISKTMISPRPGVSVATIDLTSTQYEQSRVEISEHQLSSPSLLNYPSTNHNLEESNQVMASSSMSSLYGATTHFLSHQNNQSIAHPMHLETQSSGLNATRFGANPQEDRSYQTMTNARPFPKNLISQDEESVSAIQSEEPLIPSASTNSQQRKVDESANLSGQKFGSMSCTSKIGSMADHRRCLTTEMATVGGSGAYMTMVNTTVPQQSPNLDDFTTFDERKMSLAQVPRFTAKPQTTSKKNPKQAKKNSVSKTIELSLLQGATKSQFKGHPQTTRHSSTNFGFTSFTASKGNLQATKVTSTPSGIKHVRSVKTLNTQTDKSSKQQSFVQKAVAGQKLTNLAPKFQASKIMNHSSMVAKPSVAQLPTKMTKSNTSIPQKTRASQVVHGFSIDSSELFAKNDNLSKIVRKNSLRNPKIKNPEIAQTQQRVAETAMSLEHKRITGQEDTVKQKTRTQTQLNNYVSASVQRHQSQSKKQKSQHSAQVMLGSASLGRRGTHNQTLHITNKINVSNYNTQSSLKLLNQSSTIKGCHSSTMIKQSSLKKQAVLKKAPHASSFLEQAKAMHPMSPSSVKDHELCCQEESVIASRGKALEKPKCFTTATNNNTNHNHHAKETFLAQPRPSYDQAVDQTDQKQDEKTKTAQQKQEIKRVPKHMIRASSCQGLVQKQQANTLIKMPTAKKLNQRDLSGKQVKPKTKCQFTQLQIIRQKDSSGSQSRCEDYNKTYSSNQSGAPSILPTQFKVQRQNSAADAFQSIINGCSLPASAMDSAKCQSRQTAKRSETMGLKNNYKTESAKHGTDARLSGKEHLLTSSLGKQTPSQFDFSNGLPECLRSNQQQPFATATDTGNNHALGQTKNLLDRDSMQSQAHQTSFNDFQLALASENNGAVLLSHSESSVAKLQVSDDRESDDDHKAYLHDFINSHPRDKDTSCEEKLKASGSSDDPYNVSQSILNANFPVIRDFEQFSKGKRQSEKTQKKQQFATRKHSYLQEQEAYGRQHYQGEGHLKLLKESQVYKGGQETAQRSEGSHLLLQSFLSTDPNQVCSQITVPSMSIQQQPSPVQSKSKLQSSQPPHSGLTYPNWKQTNPLESSQRSKNKLKNSSGLGSSHFKNSIKHNLHSLSQSKLLKMSNNSGAQSSFKLLSSTNGDEPLWTLSDEELTARKDVEFQKIDDFAADNQNEKSQKQHDRLTIQDAQANYPNTETDGSKDQMLRVQDILSPRDLVSVSEANRPSIDQMLPTRYSQLELDSQRQSSTRQTQNHLIMTPTQWSENYLARKQRQLDHHLCNGPGSHYDRSLVLPFQRERTASDIGMEQVIRQPSEEEQMHDHFFKNESTVQEEEYGPELNSREFTELQCAMTDTNASRIQEEHSVNNDSNLHQQASQQMSQHVSVMDGFEVDKERADQWLTNQDRLCPKVIADDTDDDDDDDDEGNEGDSCDY